MRVWSCATFLENQRLVETGVKFAYYESGLLLKPFAELCFFKVKANWHTYAACSEVTSRYIPASVYYSIVIGEKLTVSRNDAASSRSLGLVKIALAGYYL